MAEQITSEQLHRLAEVVTTGSPPVTLLACRTCGALLWDIAQHVRVSHGLEP